MSDRFPMLPAMDRKRELSLKALECPTSIPWSVIAPHERQADRNHGQTLKRLAERGGLSACEAVAVLEDRDWHKMTDEDAVGRLKEIVRAAEQGGK